MNLKDFVCTDEKVGGVTFTAKIISPSGKNNARTLKKLKNISYIVVHNTGNTSKSADDKAHGNYLQRVENTDNAYVSWHITVDSDSATQHLPLDEIAYHAGDGNGPGNTQSIGLEIAENANYEKSEENAITIIRTLMEKFSIPKENVLPHRFFSNTKKLCPWRILKSQENWQENWRKWQEKLSEIPALKINNIVKIKSGAVYGGLSNSRGKNVPEVQFVKRHTISKIERHNGILEALLQEINSWVAIESLEIQT